jgi:hypothetical protein
MPAVGIFLKRQSHWIGLLGTIFGLTLSIYFYVEGKQAGEVAIKSKNVKIVERSLPKLRILDEAGVQITGNIYGIELIVWNSGNISLGEKSDRVRRNLSLKFSSPVRIISAEIQDSKNSSVKELGARLETVDNSVQVVWSIFDQEDALKIFIIYSAENEIPYDYDARIVGTSIANYSRFQDVHSGSSVWNGYYSFLFDLRYRPNKIYLGIAYSTISIGLMIFFVRNRRRQGALLVYLGGFTAATILFAGAIIIMENFSPSAPF